MIAAVFLLLIVVLMVFVASTGGEGGITAELLVLSAVFIAFFASGIYVAATLGILGLMAGVLFSTRPLHEFAGQTIWSASTNFVFVAVPLFILMGEILLRGGLSDKLYRALHVWVSRVPGGLLHTNILSCTVFSAISGSSVATAATIGKVALPYFQRTSYDRRMVLGSLAAGGTLGILIPPSINMIVYAMLTDTSVGQLYAAGFIPGFMLAGLFMLYIFLRSSRTKHGEAVESASTWSARVRSILDLAPSAALAVIVLGSIYGGLATPTEAAALGVTGALLLTVMERRFSLSMLHSAARATARTAAMIGLIVMGAFVLNFAIGSIGLAREMARIVSGLALPPWVVMAILIGFYIALGTFMESMSMMLTTIPITFPIVAALGYDPVWFGVIIVILAEMALISPPDGIIMYVIQGMRLDTGPITDVFLGVIPFFLLMLLQIAILMMFPQVALWLPSILVQ